ncbi:sigma-E factor regulatory protein RseB domain-containing protein [Streptomonospora sediminis]
MSLVVVLLLPSSVPATADEVPAPGPDDGMELLRRASAAVHQVSFAGVQRLTTSGADDGTRLVDVVHRAGEATGYRYADGGNRAEGMAVGQTPLLMKVDELMVEELAANYRVTRIGADRVCGRTTAVLEVLRADGTTAGRFWVDKRTGLPLRKEIRDSAGRIVHASGFVEVQVGRDPGPLPEHRARPWADELSPAELESLRADGWHIPHHAAWNLELIRAWSKDGPGGRVVHLAYSDGLNIVSVFAQRGRLAGAGTGEGAAKVVRGNGSGSGISGTGQRRVWDSAGFVYTAMGQAPPRLLDAAARGFPATEFPEFWARVFRGFGNLHPW